MENVGWLYRALGALGWIADVFIVVFIVVTEREITALLIGLIVAVALLSLGLFRPQWFGELVRNVATRWPAPKE